MEEQDSLKLKKLISALIAGAVLGLLMAAVILFCMRLCGYPNSGIMLVIIVLIACVLPACFDFLGGRPELNLWIIELLMIGISFLMCMLYSNTSALNDTARTTMMVPMAIANGISLAVTAARLYLKQRKRGAAQ